MKQNNPCYLFGMYEPDTNSVIINAINDTFCPDTSLVLQFGHQKVAEEV